ncbi:hypothetical protein SLS60_011544 [Paraconiothyrium brasiliense]|uniref:Uncharacterized protein n=1 Tax=Paraconiothyrium brasiliense TaxID=300254 RepID=A0ABR3QIH3_9PLEO
MDPSHVYAHATTMAEGEKPSHHFMLNDAEMRLIQFLRALDPDENPPTERFEKLSCPVELTAFVGDRHLLLESVDGTEIIEGCAKFGAQIQEKLLSKEWIDGANRQADGHSDLADQQGASDEAPVSLTNGDWSDETRLMRGHAGVKYSKIAAVKHLKASTQLFNTNSHVLILYLQTPWDEVRSEILPSYVQNVTFTIGKSDLTGDRRKELEERFHGVVIKEAPAPQSLSGSNRSAKRLAAPEYPLEKPNGLRTAVFELDENVTTKDDALEANIRKQYPWATIAPVVDMATGASALRRNASVVGDVENQLQDLATFMADYPPDGMFDVDIPHTPIWKAVPLPQKLRIAHARTIQVGTCGETRNPATRCGNCKRNGYTCKVYRDDFIKRAASTDHINLGEGCQHCRVLGKKCDLPPHSRSTFPTVESDSASTDSTGVARAYSVDLSTETTAPTPRPSRQSSPAARTSKEQPPPRSYLLSGEFDGEGDIVDLGRRLGLNLEQPDDLWSMYDEWDRTGEIRAFEPGDEYLQDYYINLVDLNIMARTIGNAELQFATLLQFQVTIFEQELPDIDKSVIRAFEHLHVDAPLCRWIVIVFAYDWTTVEDGDYEEFVKKNVNMDPMALSKFLYGLAYIRCQDTKGELKAVLQRFCEVHDPHIPLSVEDVKCMKAQGVCETVVESSTKHLSNKTQNARNRSNKRARDESSGIKSRKKFKQNGVQQNVSRPDPRASAAREKTTDHDGDDNADDAYFTGEDNTDDINIGRQSLRSAGNHKRQANKPAERIIATSDTTRRKRGRPPKQRVVDDDDDDDPNAQPTNESRTTRSRMAALLSDDHLDSLPLGDSDFDPSRWVNVARTDSTRATTERLQTTPIRSIAGSEEPTSERKSARAKPMPPGFFNQRPKKSEFRNTMWGKFTFGRSG